MRKWIPLVLSIIGVFATPITFIVRFLSYKGPGSEFIWLVFLSPAAVRLLPYVLILLLPLLIPVFNTLYSDKKLPKFATILQLVFFLDWLVLNLLVVFAPLSLYSLEWQPYIFASFWAAIILLLAHVAHSLSQAVTRKRQGTRFFTKSSLIVGAIFGLIVIVGLGTYEVIDYHYRSRFNAVKQVVDSIETKSIKPIGGKAWEDPRYPYARAMGDGLMGMADCNATVSCPHITNTWLVPIEPGKEYEFIKSLATTNGFDSAIDKTKTNCDLGIVGETGNTCEAQGTAGTLYIAIHVERIEKENMPQSLSDVSPRIWRNVMVELTRTWGN